MANTSKDWVDRFRSSYLIDLIREVAWRELREPHETVADIYKKNDVSPCASFIPKHLLPNHKEMSDWWVKYDDADKPLISEKSWERYFNEERSPQGDTYKKIISVIGHIEGNSNKHRAEKAWESGPDGAPLWVSLKGDEEKILKAWKPHIDELNQKYTGSSVVDIFEKIPNGIYNIKNIGRNKYSETWYYVPIEWKLAHSIAVIRLNWSRYITDNSLKITLPDNIAYYAKNDLGIDTDRIIEQLEKELEEPRKNHQKDIEQLIQLVNSF